MTSRSSSVVSFAKAHPPGEIEIVHVANEGFLVLLDGRKILIDAVFGPPSISAPPADILKKVETGQAPFDNLDLILATHNHSDHFHAASVLRALAADPNTIFFSTPRAISDLQQNGLDVGFFHYGYLGSPEWMALLRETVRPRRMIPMHISPNQREDADSRLEALARGHADVHYLRESMDLITLRGGS